MAFPFLKKVPVSDKRARHALPAGLRKYRRPGIILRLLARASGKVESECPPRLPGRAGAASGRARRPFS